MQPRSLIVGDVHATPGELDDCEALLKLVHQTVVDNLVTTVVFMGDQYNTHDVMNSRVMEFWQRWFRVLNEHCHVVALRGNHDQVTPTQLYPHSMLAHPDINVIDISGEITIPGCVGMGFHHSTEDFLAEANRLAAAHPEATTLFCHQTFQGATYENSFYAKDGIDLSLVPFKRVISGHIHTPQKVGKVCYVGAPRWRTRSDANIDRHIWMFDHDMAGGGLKLVSKVSTGDVCKRIWVLEDRPEAPVQLDVAAKDEVRIDVYGPNDKYVREREAELKAQFRAKTRGFPDKQRRVAVSESEGVDKSFGRFVDAFNPPNGTSREVLTQMLGARLG